MRKDRKEDGEGDAGCGEGTGGGGTLKSERAQAPFKAMPTELRTTEKEKVKVQEEEKAEPRGPRRDPWPRRQRQAGEGGGQLGWPRAPLAASGVGSSGLPPSPEHCSFAGRQGNCLLIAEVPDGAWGRGSTGQNGSVGRAARRGSPPPVASAARPGRQQKQLLPQPKRLATGSQGSALRPRGAR